MRDGPRRLPLIALGALVALIALILTGIYIYRESTSGVLVDESGSGPGGQTTEVFTANGDWDLRWSYDCSSASNGIRMEPQCDFFLTVKQLSDCQVSPGNQGVTQHGAKGHGVVHNHVGGTFYFVVSSDSKWTFTVSGSGREWWGVGPAGYCSDF
jgi:hypothetical protein